MLKLKSSIKLIIALSFVIVLGLAFGTMKVEAVENSPKIVQINILDTNGKDLGYQVPESGGYGSFINTELNYSNCTYQMLTNNNYGDEIKTEFGNFEFCEKSGNLYIYSCPVKEADIINRIGDFELKFTATNLDTNEEEKISAFFTFYKIGFTEKAYLKVDDEYVIKEGKVIKDVITNSKGSKVAIYNEAYNSLELFDYTGNLSYSNMGNTFNIENIGNSVYTITNEDSATGIILNTQNIEVPKNTQLQSAIVNNGKQYEQIKSSMESISNKIVVYEINLTNGSTAIQPTGKVKISLPIPNDFDKTKLVVYRVSDNGDKTEYAVKVENNYATFETDHFSNYVLAEKIDTSLEETETTDNVEQTTENNIKQQLDETPKTGVETNGTAIALAITSILSLAGVVTLKRF